MQNTVDINGRRAVNWYKQRQIELVNPKDDTSIQSLAEAVKQNIIIFSKAVYSNANDKKTRNLIDLILLRAKSDLKDIYSNAILNEDDFTVICNELKKICSKVIEDFNASESYDDALSNALASFDSIFSENIDKPLNLDHDSGKSLEQLSFSEIEEKEENVLTDSVILTKVSNVEITNEINRCMSEINKVLMTISSYVNDQFSKIDQIMMLAISKISLSFSYGRSSFMSLKYAQNEMSKTKTQHFTEKIFKNGKNERNIYVYGMNIDTKMIDDLSQTSKTNIIQMSVMIKKHYENMCTPYDNILNYIEENVKLTTALINEAFQDNFMNWIKKLFNRITDYIQDNIIKPLKKTLYDWIMSKLPNIFKKISDTVKVVVEAAKGAFKLVKGVFRLIWKFIKKIFRALLRSFKFVMRVMWKGFIFVLKTIWRMIVGLIKLLFKLVRWAGTALANMWRWMKNTAFGKKVSSFIHKIGTPYRWAKTKIQSGFRIVKNKIINFKTKVINGYRFVKNGINSGLARTKNFIKGSFIKVGRGFSKLIPGFIRKGIKRTYNFVSKNIIRTFFNWIKRKIQKYVQRKIIKQAVKKGILNKVYNKLASLMARIAGRFGFSSLGPQALIKLAMFVWSMNDLIQGYKALKKMTWTFFVENDMNEFTELGPSGQYWFETWWLAKLGENIKDFFDDPIAYINKIRMFINEIILGSAEEFTRLYKDLFTFFINSKRKENLRRSWHADALTYVDNMVYEENELRNLAEKSLYGKDSKTKKEQFIKKVRKYAASIHTNSIMIADILKHLSNGVYDAKTAINYEEELIYYEMNILKNAGYLGIPARSFIDKYELINGKWTKKFPRSDYKKVEVLTPQDIYDYINPVVIGQVEDITWLMNYKMVNNEAVHVLRILDFWENKDKIKDILLTRIQLYKSYFKNRTFDLDMIKNEFQKKKKLANDFHAMAQNLEYFIDHEYDKVVDKVSELEDYGLIEEEKVEDILENDEEFMVW